MSYIKNFEWPSQRTLYIPFFILLTAAMLTVAFTLGMPWWGYVIYFVIAICAMPYLVDKEHEPVERAKASYRDYLNGCSLQELAKVVNDPNRPNETKALIREHLNAKHAGWHEQINISVPVNC